MLGSAFFKLNLNVYAVVHGQHYYLEPELRDRILKNSIWTNPVADLKVGSSYYQPVLLNSRLLFWRYSYWRRLKGVRRMNLRRSDYLFFTDTEELFFLVLFLAAKYRQQYVLGWQSGYIGNPVLTERYLNKKALRYKLNFAFKKWRPCMVFVYDFVTQASKRFIQETRVVSGGAIYFGFTDKVDFFKHIFYHIFTTKTPMRLLFYSSLLLHFFSSDHMEYKIFYGLRQIPSRRRRRLKSYRFSPTYLRLGAYLKIAHTMYKRSLIKKCSLLLYKSSFKGIFYNRRKNSLAIRDFSEDAVLTNISRKDRELIHLLKSFPVLQKCSDLYNQAIYWRSAILVSIFKKLRAIRRANRTFRKKSAVLASKTGAATLRVLAARRKRVINQKSSGLFFQLKRVSMLTKYEKATHALQARIWPTLKFVKKKKHARFYSFSFLFKLRRRRQTRRAAISWYKPLSNIKKFVAQNRRTARRRRSSSKEYGFTKQQSRAIIRRAYSILSYRDKARKRAKRNSSRVMRAYKLLRAFYEFERIFDPVTGFPVWFTKSWQARYPTRDIFFESWDRYLISDIVENGQRFVVAVNWTTFYLDLELVASDDRFLKVLTELNYDYTREELFLSTLLLDFPCFAE